MNYMFGILGFSFGILGFVKANQVSQELDKLKKKIHIIEENKKD